MTISDIFNTKNPDMKESFIKAFVYLFKENEVIRTLYAGKDFDYTKTKFNYKKIIVLPDGTLLSDALGMTYSDGDFSCCIKLYRDNVLHPSITLSCCVRRKYESLATTEFNFNEETREFNSSTESFYEIFNDMVENLSYSTYEWNLHVDRMYSLYMQLKPYAKLRYIP